MDTSAESIPQTVAEDLAPYRQTAPVGRSAVQIKAHVRLEGGRWLSNANAHRIVARSTKPTDRMGNSLPSPIFRYRDDPPYFQTWRIHKDKKGYRFQEVTHGAGICGHHRTVRELVISTLCGFCRDIMVEVL